MPKTSKSQKPPTREQLIDYIEALEGVNSQLTIALRSCLELLAANVPPEISGNKDWQDMLNQLNQVADVGERISGIEEQKPEIDKSLH